MLIVFELDNLLDNGANSKASIEEGKAPCTVLNYILFYGRRGIILFLEADRLAFAKESFRVSVKICDRGGNLFVEKDI